MIQIYFYDGVRQIVDQLQIIFSKLVIQNLCFHANYSWRKKNSNPLEITISKRFTIQELTINNKT